MSSLLRKLAHLYREGSIVRIKRGYAKGLLWKRHKRYVNGYWVGIYEIDIQRRLALEIKEGDVIFDVGANAGFFSLVASKLTGESGKVIAFEPLPLNILAIEEQIILNNLKQCKIFDYALCDKAGRQTFLFPKNKKGEPSNSKAGLASTQIEKNEDILEKINVRTLTLDEFIENEKITPNLIKVDIEGAEVALIKGAKKLLQSKKAPKLIIETHSEEISIEIEKILKSMKYRFFNINGVPQQGCRFDRHFLAYPNNEMNNPEFFNSIANQNV